VQSAVGTAKPADPLGIVARLCSLQQEVSSFLRAPLRPRPRARLLAATKTLDEKGSRRAFRSSISLATDTSIYAASESSRYRPQDPFFPANKIPYPLMQTSIGKKMLRSVNRFAHCSLLSLRFPNSFQYIQLIHSLRTPFHGSRDVIVKSRKRRNFSKKAQHESATFSQFDGALARDHTSRPSLTLA
jgi:hypothetical protein